MTDSSWAATGNYQNMKRGPGMPPFNGRHLWGMAVTYRVNPRNASVLDRENLVEIVGPLCLFCGLAYTPHRDGDPCWGSPDA